MYTTFTIKNFRGFQQLTLGPLARLNLIAGANNVGKTALLEAMFLHVGLNNPELPLRVNAIRGVERFALEAEELWGWLFHRKQMAATIELATTDAQGVTRALKLRLIKPERTSIALKPNGDEPTTEPLTTASSLGELRLEYQDLAGQSGQASVTLTPAGELELQRMTGIVMPPASYLSTRLRFAKEDTERFSKLERVGRQNELLPALQILEPRLKRLAVLVAGGQSFIYGDVGLGELLPLPLMGEGVTRLLSILLAIASAPGGVVLVDEIENGLHYSTLKGVWQALATAARAYDTQLLLTTHSWECLSAAHQAFVETGPYDFALHRLDRLADGTLKVEHYDQAALTTALDLNVEVR